MKNSFLKLWFKTQRGLHLKEHPQWSTCYTQYILHSSLRFALQEFFLVPLNILNCFPTETKLESTGQFWTSTSNLSHTVCPKFNSYGYILKRFIIQENIFQRNVNQCPKRCFCEGVPNVPKNMMVGQSIWVLWNKRKSYECSHELNMNHPLSPAVELSKFLPVFEIRWRWWNPAKLYKMKAPKQRERKRNKGQGPKSRQANSPKEAGYTRRKGKPLRSEPSTSCMKHIN